MATYRALSIQDGNLESNAIITAKTKQYKDIDLAFLPRPDKDVYKKLDAAAVKQAVKNLILTGPSEKPFQPDYGGGLGNLLFELADEESDDIIFERISNALELFEPRAILEDVKIRLKPDQNNLHARIIFSVANTRELVTLDTTLSRVR